jgi:hypothetical protein
MKWVWALLAIASSVHFHATPAWAQNYIIVLPERVDDALQPGVGFLLMVNVGFDDPAGVDVTGVSASFGTAEIPLDQENGMRWEAEIPFLDFDDMADEIGGGWTIEIEGGVLASSNTFTLNTSGLTDADFFPVPANLSPGDGDTGVAVDVLLEWDDPTGASTRAPDALVVEVDSGIDNQEASNLLGVLDPGYISISDTMWQPDDELPDGPSEFSVFYADSDASLVSTVSVDPPATISWGPPSFFPGYPNDKPFFALASETIVAFSVPEPDAGALSLAALTSLYLLVGARRAAWARGVPSLP